METHMKELMTKQHELKRAREFQGCSLNSFRPSSSKGRTDLSRTISFRAVDLEVLGRMKQVYAVIGLSRFPLSLFFVSTSGPSLSARISILEQQPLCLPR
jgi:hypothetical protein